MKLPQLLAFLGLFWALQMNAQTTLYSENFEGNTHSWTLNTTDAGSVGAAGTNYFVVNNAYTGGSGTIMCLGFPFSFTITNTQSQPGGVTGGPNSKYLHTMSTYGQANNIFCSSFAASDGICIFDEYVFSRMTNSVSTVGYTGVSFSFYWVCGGGTNIYGEVYYSTDNGTSWNLISSPISQYRNQTSWTQTTLTNAAFDNQASLKFGIRFVNLTSSSALDPGMSIDELVISGTSTVTNTIATGTLSSSSYCQAENVDVPFTATGPFIGGNVFSAELSDAAGSFSSPTVIGSLTSTTSGIVPATIPLLTPPGAGYRIRVVSSIPVVTGTDNGTNLTINAMPNPGTAMVTMDSICPGTAVTVSVTGHVGTLTWEESSDGINWVASTTMTGTSQTITPGQTVYFRPVATNSCGTLEGNPVSIFVAPAPVAAFSVNTNQLTATFTDLSTGTPLAYNWSFGDGNQSSSQNPTHTYDTLGNYTVLLTVTNSYGCTDTVSQVVVVQTTGLENDLSGVFQAWPTVVDGQLHVSSDESVHDIILSDLTGRAVRSFAGLNAGSHRLLSLDELAPGSYLLTAHGEDWKRTVRIVKQ